MRRPTVPEVLPLLRDYYEHHPGGGSPSITLAKSSRSVGVFAMIIGMREDGRDDDYVGLGLALLAVADLLFVWLGHDLRPYLAVSARVLYRWATGS